MNKFVTSLKKIYKLFLDTVLQFSDDDAFRHGAALSYYTIFALPSMMIVVIWAVGAFFGEDTVRQELLVQMKQFIGEESAQQVDFVISHIRKDKNSFFATALSIGTLVFSSTAVFNALQGSLNTFWKVRDKIKKDILHLLLDRVLSFAMVISMGFIMLVALVMQTLVVAINRFFKDLLPDFMAFAISGSQVAFSLAVSATMFVLIFKYLPNAKIRWRDAWVGAFFTAFLFMLGELGIAWYIGRSDFTSSYGAAGSLVIILAWVFYSSQIMFLGAEFTYVYSKMFGKEIRPYVVTAQADDSHRVVKPRSYFADMLEDEERNQKVEK